MIDQTELRLGNFVYEEENKICQISCLYSKKKIEFEGHDYFDDDYQIEFKDEDGIYLSKVLNPIPINSDILLKCGFENDLITWSNGICWLTNDSSGTSVFVGTLSVKLPYDIHYLHQLQNLYFSLTGKELEVKL